MDGNQQMHIQLCNLLCYSQRSLLHVSATYCGHLQRDTLWRIIT